jgi:hypothetical protein
MRLASVRLRAEAALAVARVKRQSIAATERRLGGKLNLADATCERLDIGG